MTATLEFGHKECFLRCEALQIFDQSDIWRKRQKDKRRKDEGKEAKKIKKTKKTKRYFNIVISYVFRLMKNKVGRFLDVVLFH